MTLSPNFPAQMEARNVREKIAEIERLKAALRHLVYEITHLSPEEDDGSHQCRISKPALQSARAELSEGANDGG